MKLRFLVCVLLLLSAALPCRVSAFEPSEAAKSQQARTRRGKEFVVSVLYWNIQNGMWAGQEDDYTAFVEWVKGRNPDICIWCEAQTLYKTGTHFAASAEERFLPEGWGKLARRYGHKYVSVGHNRDGYPQVITSRFPIREEVKLKGAEPDSVLMHGGLKATVRRKDMTLHLVALHTFPHDYSPLAADREASSRLREGDGYRVREVKYICDHTVGEDIDAGRHFWLMAGDFNAVSRRDNEFYRLAEEDSAFAVHDYIACHTPYCDAMADYYAGELKPTLAGVPQRIDFVYCTQALLERITSIDVIDDEYTHPVKDATPDIDFFRPSDHLPIQVDFDMSETED